MKILRFTLGFALLLTLCLSACHPKAGTGSGGDAPDSTATMPTGGIKPLPEDSPAEVQAKLLVTYERGEIEQCVYQGGVVYRCSRNAPDAGSEVFDAKGVRIGRCYYSTNTVDPVCKEATDCKVIYRMANNIWGKPAVVWVKPR